VRNYHYSLRDSAEEWISYNHIECAFKNAAKFTKELLNFDEKELPDKKHNGHN
jgi:hypothetical protein